MGGGRRSERERKTMVVWLFLMLCILLHIGNGRKGRKKEFFWVFGGGEGGGWAILDP
ncbi:MAG: hypothetical protein MJE68_27970 [Proteobacteria bacterium]|nr:hypothetical protein [Pseudomonadota bacterium]